jgi:hypothetical protein
MSATVLDPRHKPPPPKGDEPSEERRLDWVSDPNIDAVLRDVMEIISELIDSNQELQAEMKRLRGFHPRVREEGETDEGGTPP